MRYLLSCLLVLGCLGCKQLPCEPLEALHESFGVIAEEYILYVEADEALLPEEKDFRTAHTQTHNQLLEELLEDCDD